MGKTGQSVRICLGNLKRISGNPRLYLAFGWFGLTVSYYMLQLRTLAYSLDETVSAWVFPLLMERSGNQMFFILGAVLLFCDAPFLFDNSVWQILRAGRKSWFWGNILYIGILSLLYTATAALLPALFVIPRISLANEWGPLVGSMAQTSLPDQMQMSAMSYTIMARYSPLAAMGISMVMAWLNAVLVGTVSYAMNLRVKQGTGAVVCMALGLLPTVINSARRPACYIAYYLSTPSWINLENYNRSGYGAGAPPLYMYLFLAALITVCILAGRSGIMKKDLYTIEDI